MNSPTKFLQVGLGSMGKRRIRCLKALGQHDITAFDPREDRRAEAEKLYGIRTTDSFEKGLEGADAVLVSTPPDLHYPFVKAATEAGKHNFCEANIITEGADEIGGLAAAKKVVAAPSATMRFHPLYQHLKSLIDGGAIGKPLLLNFHMGNYILDWHPWEGLNFYAGKKATGACREMVPFEFEWMQWIFGPVESVQCSHGHFLDLPTDMDDAYAIVARFKSGLLANVLVDVVARYAIREGKVLSQAGTLSWDFDTQRVRHYDGQSQNWREHKAAGRGFNIEEMYVAEIDAWLKACRGEAAWEHTYAHDQALGHILLACERSSQEGRRVLLSEIR
jgi:predicted dehydrogenase